MPVATATAAAYVLQVDGAASIDTNRHAGLRSLATAPVRLWLRFAAQTLRVALTWEIRVASSRCDPGDGAAQ